MTEDSGSSFLSLLTTGGSNMSSLEVGNVRTINEPHPPEKGVPYFFDQMPRLLIESTTI